MALRKADIIKSIGKQLGLPKDKSKDIVESVLETIKQTLVNGEEVKISGILYHRKESPERKKPSHRRAYYYFPLFFLNRCRISRPTTTRPKKIPMAIAIGMAIMMLTWKTKITKGMTVMINKRVMSPIKKSISMTISWRHSVRVFCVRYLTEYCR